MPGGYPFTDSRARLLRPSVFWLLPPASMNLPPFALWHDIPLYYSFCYGFVNKKLAENILLL